MTPCFPEISTAAFGGRRRRTQDLLTQKKEALLRDNLLDLAGITAAFIPPAMLAPAESGPHSRRRIYPLRLTFHALLRQALAPDTSSADIVKQVQAARLQQGLPVPSSGTGAYTQACAKIHEELLQDILNQTVQRSVHRLPERHWKGHQVRTIDGTGLSMPDTPNLQEQWPQQSGQKPGCGFPNLSLTGLFDLHQGLLLDYRIGNKHDNERNMATELYEGLAADEVLLADRGFCHWAALADLHERGVHAVMRMNANKKWDRRCGKRLGEGDRVVQWKRPTQPTGGLNREAWNARPKSLSIRIVEVTLAESGFRTKRLVLATTLLDPVRYPAKDLIALYAQRWSVELRFREIKTIMGMGVLRSKSPEMIRKEILLYFIAYNLMRGLIAEAACVHQVPVPRVSFKGAIDQFRAWLPSLLGNQMGPRVWAKRRAIYLRMLVDSPVVERPGRNEPRAKKRRPKNYQLLSKPRHEIGHLPHRGRHRKEA